MKTSFIMRAKNTQILLLTWWMVSTVFFFSQRNKRLFFSHKGHHDVTLAQHWLRNCPNSLSVISSFFSWQLNWKYLPESVTSCVASLWIPVFRIGMNYSSSVLFTLCCTLLSKTLATLEVFPLRMTQWSWYFTVCGLFLLAVEVCLFVYFYFVPFINTFENSGVFSQMIPCRVNLKTWRGFSCYTLPSLS